MCGIFGIVANHKSLIDSSLLNEILDELFVLSESRGKESSGIAIRSEKDLNIKVLKNSISASELIRSKKYKNFLSEATASSFDKGKLISSLSIIAHARLVTNGNQENNDNNQPVIKNGAVGVHNGIIVNVDTLWWNHKELRREYEVDTEFFLDFFQRELKHTSIQSALSLSFKEIFGAASVAIFSENSKRLVLGTNTGSLYYIYDKTASLFIFSSEKFILQTLVLNTKLKKMISLSSIHWMKAGSACLVDPEKVEIDLFSLNDDLLQSIETSREQQRKYKIINTTPREFFSNPSILSNVKHLENKLEFNLKSISKLKRCNKCLLPETFPFLIFDEKGVCSYCNGYEKQNYLGLDRLHQYADQIRNKNGDPDCLVAFSGGRDSSYSLHYIKKILNLNPIAYTYDWGMVTDLARRNQARICGKLGIEHILVSADIKKKRNYIRKNVSAWLQRPRLGTIPLFMAGDKQFFYYAYHLRKVNNLKETILCENMLERTNFKSGFCGIAPHFDDKHNFGLSTPKKLQMLMYYGKEFLLNPSYLNSSIWDSTKAFFTYYVTPHSYFNLFDYLPWEEEIIEKTLIEEYDWELSPDTKTTWRIGDGTAAFYNYIYYTVSGFSEFDTFRSNQIREGMMSREEALDKVNEENFPRFESIQWYLSTIGLDFEKTISIINSIPKLYQI